MIENRGFTLIELMIVIAIMSILAILEAGPLMDYLANARVRGKADEIRSYISLAKAEAIKRNATVTFNYDNGVISLASGGTEFINNTITTNLNVAPDKMSISFSGSGRTFPQGTTLDVSVKDKGRTCKADGGSVTCLDIRVGLGGIVKLCDPAQASTHVYSC